MPNGDISVTDEKGIIHVFPSGSTPDMIAKAMKVNLPGAKAATPTQPTTPPPTEGIGSAALGVGSDLLQGVGEGALQTVATISKGLNKIPLIGETLAPKQGIAALSQIATPENLTQRIGAAGEQIGETVAAGPLRAGATKALASRLPARLARILTEAGTAGASAGLHDQPVGTSAALGAAGQTLSEGARAVAPSLAESAVGITERMRGRGRTIGEALLEKTSGLSAKTVAKSTQKVIDTLTKQMEHGVDSATQLGATGSSQGAQQVLTDAIAKTPRNARTLLEKLRGLHDVLDLRPQGSTGPAPTTWTPNELLEMKRGIGKEIESWGPEWQKVSEVKQLEQRLYGAIDKELDRLVPGNEQLNQQISSLSPARKAAMRRGDAAGIPQKIGHRVAAHTGALAGAGLGSVYGYEKGGTAGAVAGGIAGLAIPEVLTAPTTQMGAARMLASPRGRSILPLLRALLLQKQTDQ